jgi:hypothetical protein
MGLAVELGSNQTASIERARGIASKMRELGGYGRGSIMRVDRDGKAGDGYERA